MMKALESGKLTFWVDYDRERLSLLSRAQRIEYFRRRANMVVLRPLRYLLRGIRPISTRSSAVLCFGTCICCAIEAFGRFHTGKVVGDEGQSFKCFIRDFMDRGYRKQLGGNGKSYATLVYDYFRKGLAHGFTIKSGGFEDLATYFQEKMIGSHLQLVIDPSRMLEDLEQAATKFVDALKTAPDVSQRYAKFSTTFDALWVRGE